MSTTQICPGCKVRLVIRNSVRAEFITCPRCLVAVKNPQAASASGPVRCPRCGRERPGHLASCAFCGESPAPTAGAAVCTVCAEELPAHAGNCPNNASQRAQRAERPWSAPPADREASGDISVTYIFAVLLSAMVIAGVGNSFGPQPATAAAVFLVIAVVSGGRQKALSNVVRLLIGLAVMGAVLFTLAFVALLIMCGGRRGW